jgi:hypothetical protein
MPLDFKNLVAEVLPVAISPAAMVEEKGWFGGRRIFEPGEQFPFIDTLGALSALLCFKHHFLTSRGTQGRPYVCFEVLLHLLGSFFGILKRIHPSCTARLHFGNDRVQH